MSEAETILETLISMVPKELVEKVHGSSDLKPSDLRQPSDIFHKMKVIYGQAQKPLVVTDISGKYRKEYSRYGDALNHYDWCKDNLSPPGVVIVGRRNVYRYSDYFTDVDEAVETLYNNIVG